MRFRIITTSLLSLAGLCCAAPAPALSIDHPRRHSACEQPPVRKEWRSLEDSEKQGYLDAVLCLENHPAITKAQFANNPYLNPVNRYDDFVAVHHDQTPAIHWVGHFSLWHRYFVAEYEKTLRDICHYTGAQPYWNWARDASSTNNDSTAIFETEIFSPTIGLGGNGPYIEATPAQDPVNLTAFGRTGGGCLEEGPFVQPHFNVNVNKTEPTCLKRDFIPVIMNWFAQRKNVDYVLSQPNFATFAYALEGVPQFTQPNIHGSGHFGVGGALGDIGNPFNSPSDPLFYLHHGNLDRVLWQWQQKDLETRLNQVGGPIVPFDYGGENVTLDFEVNLGTIAGSVTLHELLDTEGGLLCYTYDE